VDRRAIKDTYKNSHVIKNFSDNFVVFFFLRDRVDVINFSVISVSITSQRRGKACSKETDVQNLIGSSAAKFQHANGNKWPFINRYKLTFTVQMRH